MITDLITDVPTIKFGFGFHTKVTLITSLLEDMNPNISVNTMNGQGLDIRCSLLIRIGIILQSTKTR
jgi:hypothetical protein